jgi:chorismate-pyruvate lyase
MLFPLDVLYARCGVAPPVARPIAPGRLPAAAATLLRHEGEMTQTLERHVGDRLLIRVMATMRNSGSYFRRALLAEEATARPVAMGAVRLTLGALSARARGRILREREPLGRVLREGGMACRSLPVAFFRVAPNAELMAVFGMRKPAALYGRRTRLMHGDTRIGDIVEILSRL